MIRKRPWLVGLVALAAAQFALWTVWNQVAIHRAGDTLPVQVEHRSEPAHDFIVEDSNGKRFEVPARSGRYQLVHFWATWCPPCRAELPTLLAMAKRNRDRLEVWAVSTDREWATVQRFLKGPMSPRVVRDPDGSGSRRYGVTGLPDTYLIDPQGRIKARFSGAQNWNGHKMDKILEQLIIKS